MGRLLVRGRLRDGLSRRPGAGVPLCSGHSGGHRSVSVRPAVVPAPYEPALECGRATMDGQQVRLIE